MLLSHSTKKRMFDRIRMLFGGAPCLLQAAALPWRLTADGIEIMLVTSRGTGRWVLPKGWPERHEELWDAAGREAGEEAGVSGAVSREALGSFFYGKDMAEGMQYRCEVHVYPLEVDKIAEKWPERRHRKRTWFSPQEAASLVREGDLAELITHFGTNPRQIAA
jgi:8-oxo-dGTP pyrophosphatase MutT (NUDIX family)